MTSDNAVRVPCPFCREPIISGAIKCKHCGSNLESKYITNTQITNGDSSPSKVGIEATKTCFRKYAVLDGRASRSEFWYFFLFLNIIGWLIAAIFGNKYGASSIGSIFSIATIVPYVSAAIRRLHDTGRSGYWFLLAFTLIGAIPLIYWFAKPGDAQTNRFGPNPLQQAAEPGPSAI